MVPKDAWHTGKPEKAILEMFNYELKCGDSKCDQQSTVILKMIYILTCY